MSASTHSPRTLGRRKAIAWLVGFATLLGVGGFSVMTASDASAENVNPPVSVTVGTATHAVSGVNRARGTDELIDYSSEYGTNTGTNQWGVEAVIHWNGTAFVVSSVRDRQPSQDLTPTVIPAHPDYVMSAHGTSADWMRANVTVGKTVTSKDSAGASTTWPGGTVSGTSPPPSSTSASTSPSATCTPAGAFALGISKSNWSAANNWQTNHAIRALGTWSDDGTTNIYDLNSTSATNGMASWNGIVDIAVGGLTSGQTWAGAAAGSYNSTWQTKILNLKSAWGTRPAGNLYVRFAHEFNGNFSDWYASDADAANFVSAFRRWASLLQTNFPGAHPVWSPNDGGNVTHISDFWPGNDKADLIAVDKYNAWPHRTTAADITAALTETDSNGNPVGAEAWRQFALTRGVPMGFGEIGNPANSAASGGGGDAPAWFDVMNQWSVDHGGTAAGNVTYGIWFNETGYSADYVFFNGTGASANQPQFASRFQNATVAAGGTCPSVSPSGTPTATSVSPTATSTSASPTATSTSSVSPSGSSSSTCAPASTVTVTQTVTASPTGGVTTTPPPTSVTPTSTTTSTTTSPVSGAYPANEIAAYQMMWSTNTNRIPTIPSQINVVRLAFFNDGGNIPGGSSPGLVGYSSAGKGTLVANLRTWLNAGTASNPHRVVLSGGGGGYTLNTSNPTNVVNRIKAVVSDLSDAQGPVISGFDWDDESGTFNDAGTFAVSQQLVNFYGPNFAISMVPNGGTIGTYITVGKHLQDNGLLTSFGQQFYDAPMDYASIKSRIQQAVSGGIPLTKYAVGMMAGTDSSHPSVSTYSSWMTQLRSELGTGLHRSYYWELGDTSNAASWASSMYNIYGNG